MLFSFVNISAFAQSKYATINGVVVDENDAPLKSVSIVILGKNTGILTTDSGTFSIKVPAKKSLALIFSYAGYAEQQKNFFLSGDEIENILVQLKRGGKVLETVVVGTEKERKELGLVKVNPKIAIIAPSTVGGVEGLIKTLVGSNNELTSQYNVRGGNYDENLIYINDFEIYRPYLISSGQQEGLSLINPEMTRNINFYTGGFQSKYGDKMSSVLDITYRKPLKFGGSASASFLGGNAQLEGVSNNRLVAWSVGARYRTNSYLLKNLDTKLYCK